MKRNILYGFMLLFILICLTGCGSVKFKEKQKDSIKLDSGKVSIVCIADNFGYSGIDQKIETTYNFDENLYAINYKVVTTQKFKSKSVYKTYKDAQEDTVKTNSSSDILYSLDVDSKNKTLIFTVAVPSIDINSASDAEKERLKASTILKSIESANDAKYNCKVNGISRSKLN